MPNTNLIQTKLPQDLRDKAASFQIAENLLDKIPDIIELVLRSRSMDKDSDKQSWFNLLPLMNQEQIDKLKDILVREKQKLAEIEKKYEDKKTNIKEKFVQKFEEGQIHTKNAIHKSRRSGTWSERRCRSRCFTPTTVNPWRNYGM
jgi:BMFP domain-containing protein YqiC